MGTTQPPGPLLGLLTKNEDDNLPFHREPEEILYIVKVSRSLHYVHYVAHHRLDCTKAKRHNARMFKKKENIAIIANTVQCHYG